jgi:hypothetical protein
MRRISKNCYIMNMVTCLNLKNSFFYILLNWKEDCRDDPIEPGTMKATGEQFRLKSWGGSL